MFESDSFYKPHILWLIDIPAGCACLRTNNRRVLIICRDAGMHASPLLIARFSSFTEKSIALSSVTIAKYV